MQTSGILLRNEEQHSRTLFSSMCMYVLASILSRNRIEPQYVDLVSFPVTTSQKFKFERVTSNSFHVNRSP